MTSGLRRGGNIRRDVLDIYGNPVAQQSGENRAGRRTSAELTRCEKAAVMSDRPAFASGPGSDAGHVANIVSRMDHRVVPVHRVNAARYSRVCKLEERATSKKAQIHVWASSETSDGC